MHVHAEPGELTVAVREAATTGEKSALIRLEELLRSGVTAGPHEEPPIVEAVYRSHAEVVLPLLFKYDANPSQLRSDGVPVLELAARRRSRAAAVDLLLYYGARLPPGPRGEQSDDHFAVVSAEDLLVRGDQDFFGLLTVLLEHVSTCAATADPDVGYLGCPTCDDEPSWIEDGCPEVLARLKEPLLPSPCRPENTAVLLMDVEALPTIQAALEFCGDCVIAERPAARDIFEGVERELFQLIEEKDWFTRPVTMISRCVRPADH